MITTGKAAKEIIKEKDLGQVDSLELLESSCKKDCSKVTPMKLQNTKPVI